MGVRIEPVTAARWEYFTALFDSTWVRSCSCMWFRVTQAAGFTEMDRRGTCPVYRLFL